MLSTKDWEFTFMLEPFPECCGIQIFGDICLYHNSRDENLFTICIPDTIITESLFKVLRIKLPRLVSPRVKLLYATLPDNDEICKRMIRAMKHNGWKEVNKTKTRMRGNYDIHVLAFDMNKKRKKEKPNAMRGL